MMFETSHDDLLLFPSPDAEGVDELLFSGVGSGSGGLSLAEALMPLVQSPSLLTTDWLYSTRYKTELCSRYAETGYCKYAKRCQFAHGLHELHVPSRHPKYKTELCRAFHTAGYCVYGTRCLFVHSAEEQRPTRQRRRNVPCRTFRSFGVCPFGTRCHFLHVEGSSSESVDSAEDDQSWALPRPSATDEKACAPPHAQEWKPRGALCRTFSSFGFCLYGTRCRFQHGLPSTIRRPDCNLGPAWSLQVPGRAMSPASDMRSTSPTSSSSSSPSALASPVYPDDSGPLTPLSSEPMAHNAFTFSSQHLNDLLLPLAVRLQQLEHSQAWSASPNDVVDSLFS